MDWLLERCYLDHQKYSLLASHFEILGRKLSAVSCMTSPKPVLGCFVQSDTIKQSSRRDRCSYGYLFCSYIFRSVKRILVASHGPSF